MAIGNELEDQNEMLDELSEAMDNTDRRLVRETGHVMRVTEKAKSGGAWQDKLCHSGRFVIW